jgi:precorrin-6B C5,15-methyltransferase / cobalt-precorrin-6B C5,C15-methyltransferase
MFVAPVTKWLTIVGMGEDGFDGLSQRSCDALRQASHIVGSKRLLGFLPSLPAERVEWPQPFADITHKILPLRGMPTVILATGDPMNFGVGRKLLEFLPSAEIEILPHLSSFSLAAARLGWSIPDCDCFTIHGRPAANVEAYIQPRARLIILTEDGTSIAECARRLLRRGFDKSKMTVLENMGGTSERITTFIADDVPVQKWSDLNTLAVECVASSQAKIWSRAAGLPDEAFEHDGKITKREVRAATIAALAPTPDTMLWDIGAGSGSVAIEWMRQCRGCEAVAVECDKERAATISRNADALGTPRLKIVVDMAPDCLAALPRPDAIFIGGGISTNGTFEACWSALKHNGKLVCNVVTLEGEKHLIELQDRYGGDLVRFDVSVISRVGNLRAMRPRMSVLQWCIAKP